MSSSDFSLRGLEGRLLLIGAYRLFLIGAWRLLLTWFYRISGEDRPKPTLYLTLDLKECCCDARIGTFCFFETSWEVVFGKPAWLACITGSFFSPTSIDFIFGNYSELRVLFICFSTSFFWSISTTGLSIDLTLKRLVTLDYLTACGGEKSITTGPVIVWCFSASYMGYLFFLQVSNDIKLSMPHSCPLSLITWAIGSPSSSGSIW